MFAFTTEALGLLNTQTLLLKEVVMQHTGKHLNLWNVLLSWNEIQNILKKKQSNFSFYNIYVPFFISFYIGSQVTVFGNWIVEVCVT